MVKNKMAFFRKHSINKKKQLRFIIIGLTPIMIYFFIFSIFPVFYSLYISLHKWDIMDIKKPFIGLSNFKWALTDHVFYISLYNTVYYSAFYVTLITILGLLIAVFVNSLNERFISFMRGVIFAPVVTSMVAVCLMFNWLYQPMYGVLNYVIGLIGLGPYDWLNSSKMVIPSIIIMSVWKSVGYTMVIFLAGITTIPYVYYEAAQVDGASKFWSFLNITLPLLKPTTLFVVVTSLIGSFQVFTQVYVMTGGGPGTSSRTLVMHIYETGFKFFEMGRASAVAYLLFAIVLIITLIQLKYLKSDFEY